MLYKLPLLCLTAFIKLHLKRSCTRTGKDGGLMAAVLVIVRRLHVPGPEHHWLLRLVPIILINLNVT